MEHLIVIVPGIGGSILSDGDDTVWDAGLRDIAGLAFNQDRLNTAENPSLTPTGLVGTTRLGTKHNRLAWLPGWTIVHGYDLLFDKLKDAFPDAVIDRGDDETHNDAADIVGFPYDFRYSVTSAAEKLDDEIKRRLRKLAGTDTAKPPRVIIVAHSMGGLVARYWLGPLRGSPLCRALVTLGTPHRGAPKALNALVNGIGVGSIRPKGLSETFRGWAGVFDLLPTYKAVGVIDTHGAITKQMYAHELPLNTIAEQARRSFAVHQDITNAWAAMPRSGPEMVAYYGHSHKTPISATWDPSSTRLRVSKRHPTWLKASKWEQTRGDGTVPAISAIPLELSEAVQGTERTKDRHGPIAISELTAGLIGLYEDRGNLGLVLGENTQDVAVGLNVDDAHEIGAPIAVEATMTNWKPTRNAEIWATLKRDGIRVDSVRLEKQPIAADESSFVGQLTAKATGFHQLEIDALQLGVANNRKVTDALFVTD